jgi:hypothetical protein
MPDDTLNMRVGIEILLKIDSLTENIRKVGIIQGWIGQELIIVKINDEKNIQHFNNSTPLLVGFVYNGITYGFKSKLVLKLRLLSHNIFSIEYPKETKKLSLRKNERFKVELPGNLKLIQEGLSIKDYPIIDFLITDLSIDGCGLTTKIELKKGDKILLSFILPPDNMVTNLPAMIVNVSPSSKNENYMGVRYYPKNEHKETLDRYISLINEIKSMAGIKDL